MKPNIVILFSLLSLLFLYSCQTEYKEGECLQKADETLVWKVVKNNELELQSKHEEKTIKLSGNDWIKTSCP